jgi:hypothetical protein
LISKVCKRPFEQNRGNNFDINISSDSEAVDVKKAIRGLISIFKNKLFSLPGSTAIQAFKIIVSHLSAHYMCVDYSCIGQIGSAIKQEVRNLFTSCQTLRFYLQVVKPYDFIYKFSNITILFASSQTLRLTNF